MIGIFELYYPIFMSFVWILGSSYLALRKEKLLAEPAVDVFMACHNEEQLLYQSVKSLCQQNYKKFSNCVSR